MKKLLCIFLSILLVLPLISCSTHKIDIQDPINFYYRKTQMDYGAAASVLGKEVRDSNGNRNNYSYLIYLYLQGPTNYAFYSPFPKDTSLVSIDLREDTAYVLLSPHMAQLTDLQLSIACACMTMTVCEMTGAENVCISAVNSTLDGNPSITMSLKNILLLDDSNIEINPN